MRFHGHRAFTLIELLVVVAIIGLIASAALVFVKDTADVKALSYTKRVMASVKAGIADSDSDGYFTGFVNDFGTMPPHANFILNSDDGTFSFIGDSLTNHRFSSMAEQNGTAFPAPFMTKEASGDYWDDLNGSSEKLRKVLYAGYHGGYLADSDDGLDDGWNTPLLLSVDLNISAANDNGKAFVKLRSFGSDRKDDNVSVTSLIREEFDFSKEEKSIEALYANDYNQTYDKRRFTVDSLNIDITLSQKAVGAEVNATAILVYSPMLYYVKDSGNLPCSEYNTTHAECDGSPIDHEYIPYIIHNSHPDQIDHLIEQNLSWHIGLIKYQLYFDHDNKSRLFINRGGIRSDDDDALKLAYDFNRSDPADNFDLTASRFFDGFRVRYIDTDGSVQDKSWTFDSAPADDANPFYLFAGTKVVSVWEHNGSGWFEDDTFTVDFKPGRRQKIELECR